MRIVAISSKFRVILRVKEHFGLAGGDGKSSSSRINQNDEDEDENRKSMIKEEIRSISRSF